MNVIVNTDSMIRIEVDETGVHVRDGNAENMIFLTWEDFCALNNACECWNNSHQEKCDE